MKYFTHKILSTEVFKNQTQLIHKSHSKKFLENFTIHFLIEVKNDEISEEILIAMQPRNDYDRSLKSPTFGFEEAFNFGYHSDQSYRLSLLVSENCYNRIINDLKNKSEILADSYLRELTLNELEIKIDVVVNSMISDLDVVRRDLKIALDGCHYFETLPDVENLIYQERDPLDRVTLTDDKTEIIRDLQLEIYDYFRDFLSDERDEDEAE
jgi:hypothetical protein